MHNPELHALAAVTWQYFCSFTFKSERHCARFGPQMFVALVRTQARSFGVHFSESALVPAAGAWRGDGPLASARGNRGAAPCRRRAQLPGPDVSVGASWAAAWRASACIILHSMDWIIF